MDGVYENIHDYNSSRKRKILIIFDDMIADYMTNKKISIHIKRIIYQIQKIKYFTCFYYYPILFFCSKRYQIKFKTLFNYENYYKRELQNIAINHSVDIDYQDFINIYRECTKEPYKFLTIDTKLPASDSLRFRKKLFDSYKNDNN